MEITCDYCSKKFEYTEGQAHYERTEHHYCSRGCQAKGNNGIQGNNIHGLAKKNNGRQHPRYCLWLQAKKRATKKGVEFDIKPSDIPEIPDKCPVLGIELKINSDKKSLDSSPSLDRVDNEKGYIKGNLEVISHRANRLKGDFDIDEIKSMLNYLQDE